MKRGALASAALLAAVALVPAGAEARGHGVRGGGVPGHAIRGGGFHRARHGYGHDIGYGGLGLAVAGATVGLGLAAGVLGGCIPYDGPYGACGYGY